MITMSVKREGGGYPGPVRPRAPLSEALSKTYRVAKEVLIFVNLLLAAIIMGVLVYTGSALLMRLSPDTPDTPAPVPVEAPTEDPANLPVPPVDSEGCEAGQSYDTETGLCYPDGE